jgi:hypothetical protein
MDQGELHAILELMNSGKHTDAPAQAPEARANPPPTPKHVLVVDTMRVDIYADEILRTPPVNKP